MSTSRAPLWARLQRMCAPPSRRPAPYPTPIHCIPVLYITSLPTSQRVMGPIAPRGAPDRVRVCARPRVTQHHFRFRDPPCWCVPSSDLPRESMREQNSSLCVAEIFGSPTHRSPWTRAGALVRARVPATRLGLASVAGASTRRISTTKTCGPLRTIRATPKTPRPLQQQLVRGGCGQGGDCGGRGVGGPSMASRLERGVRMRPWGWECVVSEEVCRDKSLVGFGVGGAHLGTWGERR
jgi:hypothetical protein